ncbi:hypothetical protein [Myceligenerans pegani]|uniref:Uncharacterized protein n=1 Tax=Myceligenerans pegani TaxID=2776917 RepID=A0ABR9N0U2_9MICO|nr:hypothetical protein [Myceligenerans sp. TRM 65318]MBE1876683.1 hypothetical protein [Myceligenerans sp. TRM 65318]MBE3018954.1 hypothetical protein [Myceligenerans sp. TRM 65318]
MSRTRRSQPIRLLTIGAAATGVCIASAGLAFAAPGSAFGQAVGGAIHAAGVDWSLMPEGYTEAQYEAYWNSGYSAEDLLELQAIWSLDETEAKSRAGQMILDGEQLPFEPGAHTSPGMSPAEQAAIDEFWAAGYTVEDVEALNDLWDTEHVETKARAGQMLIDGETLPVEPSGSRAATAD